MKEIFFSSISDHVDSRVLLYCTRSVAACCCCCCCCYNHISHLISIYHRVWEEQNKET